MSRPPREAARRWGELPLAFCTLVLVSAIPMGSSCHAAWDSCMLPSKEPGRFQTGFGACPVNGHPMVRGHVGEQGH